MPKAIRLAFSQGKEAGNFEVLKHQPVIQGKHLSVGNKGRTIMQQIKATSPEKYLFNFLKLPP